MKEALRELVLEAVAALRTGATLPIDLPVPAFAVERVRSREHGDFASHVALLAEPAGAPPRELAALPAAANLKPHLIADWLRERANALHTYYNAHPFLVDDVALRNARLALIVATHQVLKNGLDLLGLSAPESM